MNLRMPVVVLLYIYVALFGYLLILWIALLSIFFKNVYLSKYSSPDMLISSFLEINCQTVTFLHLSVAKLY